jgi:hypothetical protein
MELMRGFPPAWSGRDSTDLGQKMLLEGRPPMRSGAAGDVGAVGDVGVVGADSRPALS